MSLLAFPGCSAKFFNRDCIIIFNPHNNSPELEILIPDYMLGNWDLWLNSLPKIMSWLWILSLKSWMAGCKPGQSFPTCRHKLTLKFHSCFLGQLSLLALSLPLYTISLLILPCMSVPHHHLLLYSFPANRIYGFRLYRSASPSPTLT